MGLPGRPGRAGLPPSARPPPGGERASAALDGTLVRPRGAPPVGPLTARPPVAEPCRFHGRSVTRGGTELALTGREGDRDVGSHWRGRRAQRGNRDAGLR